MASTEERFSRFYGNWLTRLEAIIYELNEVTRNRDEVVMSDSDLQAVVSKVNFHLLEFYSFKWTELRTNPFSFLSPVWPTCSNKRHLWFSTFNPSTMVFRLLDTMRNPQRPPEVMHLPLITVTMAQGMKIEELRIRNQIEEEMVDKKMDRILKHVYDPKIEKLMNISKQLWGENLPEESVARLDALVLLTRTRLMSDFENVFKTADYVRLRSLNGVLSLLTPMQCLQFLTSFLYMEFLSSRKQQIEDTSAAPKPDEDKEQQMNPGEDKE